MDEVPRSDLVTAVRGHAEADPDRMALTWLEGLAEPTGRLTYGALDDAAAAVASALLRHAAPGDRVLLVQPPGLDFVTSFLGCLYAGCVPVPVYPLFDTEENIARIRRVREDSGAALIWTFDEGVAAHLADLLKTPARWAVDAGRHRPSGSCPPDSLAFLQYTSGSTADPRGVMVTHGNLAANLNAIRRAFEHRAEDVVLSWLPSYHDMGLIGNILLPLYVGSRAYLGSPIGFIRRPLSWLTAVDRYGVTTSGAPNFAYELVVKAAGQEELPRVDLSRWRTAYCGAEPISRRSLSRFAELLAPSGFRGQAFAPCYGLAESTLLVSSVPVGAGVSTRESPDGVEVVSCGVPRDCAVAIVDGAGKPVPDGEIGEIAVQGPSVGAGYFNRPRDGRTFGASVAGTDGDWLRTGDLGFRQDEELFVTGRIKDLIVLRGRNHYPQDLERLALDLCPALRPGCAVAFASADEEAAVLVAELKGSAPLTEADVRALATAAATTFGLALREVVAVPRGTVPKTTSGKLRRAACRTAYLDGAYDTHRRARPGGSRDAGTVRSAVRDVLGADVPEDEPLVAYGLDSLGAVRLAELLVRRTGVDVPVRALLGGASTADLAALAANGEPASPDSPDAPDTRRSHDGLSKAQQALLFLHMLNPASDEYTISFAWELAPSADPAVFDQALRTTLSAHAELAVRFVQDENGWRREQVGAAAFGATLALTPVPTAEDRLDDQLAAAAELPFDLGRDPLLRVYLWQTPRRRVHQLVVHHLVTDLWSIGLLMRDLAACYTDLAAGRRPAPPAAAAYDSYVREQDAYLASEQAAARDEQLRTLLPDRARSLGLRTDAPHPARRNPRADQVSTTLPVPSGPEDPIALVITVWALTLYRYGTPAPVVIGVPISGRGHGRHAAVSGLCTNTAPIALDPSTDQPMSVLAAAARDQLDQGMHAGLYPMARAVEAVRPARVSGRHPLVETVVTFHESPMPEVPGMLDAVNGAPADLELGALALRTVPVPRHSCRYDLDLLVTPRDGEYLLTLNYAAEVFHGDTARSLLENFAAALAVALADPGAPLTDALVLCARDEELIAGAGSRPSGPLDPAPLERIRAVAADDPDRPAVQAPEVAVGYRDFTARVDRIAAALTAATATEGER